MHGYILSCEGLLQILMNVNSAHVPLEATVSILMDLLCAHVMLDTTM